MAYSSDSNPTTTPPSATDPVTQRVADAAHDIIERLAKHAAQAEQRIRQSAETVEQGTRSASREAQIQGEEIAGQVRDYVHEHPMAALGLAFGVGLLASVLLRR